MNILSHGMPFFRHPSLLTRYRGTHSVRSISAHEEADYTYDPARDSLADILARISPEWRPDLLLFWFPENDPPPAGVEDAPIPTVAMAGDWNLFHPYLRLNLSRYDYVLCDKGAVSILAGDYVQPAHLLPLYAQNSVLHRPCPAAKDIDILFVGNMNFARYRERGQWLERVARLGDRYRVALVENAFGEAYNRLLNRARIVFNHSVRGELNLRTFETMAAGSLAFVEADNTEVRDWFQEGVEVVLYTETNLEERLAYYLEHPEAAEAIARRGHARAPEFALENRFDTLIDGILRLPMSGRRFHELPPIEQAVQTFMQYHGTLTPAYMAIEQRHMALMARMAPDDPRVWAGTGRCLLMPKMGGIAPDRAELALKTLQRAADLAPDSAPCAYNLATACTHLGREDAAEPFLQRALECRSEDLGEFLIGWIHVPRTGWPHCRMWNRCLVAQATRGPFLHILHGEAHVRLAHRLAARGAGAQAEAHLAQAQACDPENPSRITLQADILWHSGRPAESAGLLWNERDSFHVDMAFREDLLARLDAIGDTARRHHYEEETCAVRQTLAFSRTVGDAP